MMHSILDKVNNIYNIIVAFIISINKENRLPGYTWKTVEPIPKNRRKILMGKVLWFEKRKKEKLTENKLPDGQDAALKAVL